MHLFYYSFVSLLHTHIYKTSPKTHLVVVVWNFSDGRRGGERDQRAGRWLLLFPVLLSNKLESAADRQTLLYVDADVSVWATQTGDDEHRREVYWSLCCAGVRRGLRAVKVGVVAVNARRAEQREEEETRGREPRILGFVGEDGRSSVYIRSLMLDGKQLEKLGFRRDVFMGQICLENTRDFCT